MVSRSIGLGGDLSLSMSLSMSLSVPQLVTMPLAPVLVECSRSWRKRGFVHTSREFSFCSARVELGRIRVNNEIREEIEIRENLVRSQKKGLDTTFIRGK